MNTCVELKEKKCSDNIQVCQATEKQGIFLFRYTAPESSDNEIQKDYGEMFNQKISAQLKSMELVSYSG